MNLRTSGGTQDDEEPRNQQSSSELIAKAEGRHRQMVRFQQQWRSGAAETTWLTMLIETFENLSDPNRRAVPCDPDVVLAAKAHLARPSWSRNAYGSRFSLRN
jgi:hypothetical protein